MRLLTRAIELFNAQDLDQLVELLHPMVEWPDLMDDKLIWGRQAVRDYWERQLVIVRPHLTPMQFVPIGDDLVVVSTQRVFDRHGGQQLLDPQVVVQRFGLRDGLIATMTTFASIEAALA